MAAVKISGVLKDGAGKPIQNCTIQLKAKRNSTTVLVNTVASENPDEAGRYSMDVEHGQYSVTLLVEGFPPSHAGTITVYEGSRPGTLNDFLGAMTEDDVMPEALRRFEAMVEEAARNAEAASQSAAAAKKSETAAASSKNAAKTSETNAANSAQAAASSQTASANSATAAKKSETNAKNSETAAKTSETNAKSSQTAAKTSETNAKASETAAKNSQDAAAQSESAAAGSASAAAASATASANSQKAAKTSETNAKASETAATNSAKASAASQMAAKASEDAAREYASQAAEPYKQVLQPLPDVWIPFNDSLEMITGFAPGYKKITVGDDVITMPSDKVVNFKRASGATYINKAGVLTIADVDEPRFEKDGLLIEGQRTNYFINSNSPELWNPNPGLEISKTKTDPLGFKYATFKPGEFSGGTGAYTVIAGLTPNKIPVVKNDMVTISFRAKGNNVRFGARFDKGDPLSAVAIAYIDCDSLGIHLSGGDIENIVAKNAVRVGEWVFVEVVYKITDETTHVRGVITIANKTGGGILDETSFMDLTTPQIEVGSCASSFIITEGSPTTRASDQVIIQIPMNWATPPICALMEVNVNWGAVNKMPNIEGSARLLNVSITGATTDVADESYMYFGFTSGGNRLIITNGKGTKTEYKAYGDRVENKFIAGFRFTAEKNLQVVVDGVFGTESPSLWTKQRYIAGSINIGGQAASGNRHLFGHVRNLRIWHKELTEAQMGESIK